MGSDKIARLTKYADDMTRRLQGQVPEKHNGSDQSRNAYKTFLMREIRLATKEVETLKLNAPSKK